MRIAIGMALYLSGVALAAEPLATAMAELQPSSLSRDAQQAELQWFIDAARPFQGMQIRVIAERIDTHWYEANVLAPLFS